MSKRRPGFQATALLAFLALSGPLAAANLVITGGTWSSTLTAADLMAGAGTNLPPTLQSASALYSAEITFSPLIGAYRVYARVSATGLPAGVTLAVRRTSDGSSFLSLGAISGGTGYQTLATTDIEIFSGFLDRSNIAMQVRASGLSVAATPALYQSSIIFTITP